MEMVDENVENMLNLHEGNTKSSISKTTLKTKG